MIYHQLRFVFIKNLCRIYSKILRNLNKYLKILGNKRVHSNYTLAHITHYSCGNAGDNVLSTCVRKIFNLNIKKISWYLFSMVKKVDDEVIHKFNQCDAIVIGGHGAFLPDTNPNNISGWEFACSVQQYDEITKPIIVFAVGYNYFKGQNRTELFEKNINKLVDKSDFFSVRNMGSVKIIQSFIDDNLKDKVVFQPCPTMISKYLYKDLPKKQETHKVAFNVALDRAQMRMGESKDVILDQIAKSMYEISKRGYEIHFITHLNREIEFLKYIDRYKFKYKFHAAATWSAKHLIEFYNDMDVVIGMRGHGIWIPFGVNCHIISLSSQEKTKWFLEDINALDWYIDISQNPDTLCNQIVEKFIDIHEVNGESTTKRLIEEQEKLYTVTCENMKMIKKIIEKNCRKESNLKQ